MRAEGWLTKCPAPLLLIGLLLAVAGVCFCWVVTVPIYQSPDETAHLDYALAIYQHGGPFAIHGPPGERLPLVHPYTHYLIDRTATQAVAFHGAVRMPPRYGSVAFFEELERACPPRDALPADVEPPGLAWVYPFGYYTVLAGWIHLLVGMKEGLVVIFFGARLLSVLLLLGSLLFSYGAA